LRGDVIEDLPVLLLVSLNLCSLRLLCLFGHPTNIRKLISNFCATLGILRFDSRYYRADLLYRHVLQFRV
jgi:hypothetical protein